MAGNVQSVRRTLSFALTALDRARAASAERFETGNDLSSKALIRLLGIQQPDHAYSTLMIVKI